MIYDQSFCNLCGELGAGNLCLHRFFSSHKTYSNQIFVRQIVNINDHTFVFYLVLLTQCIRPFFF